MNNVPKKFDSVQMMRSIRDSISSEIENMTLEEERQWFASQAFEDPFLQRLQEKTGPQKDVAHGVTNRR